MKPGALSRRLVRRLQGELSDALHVRLRWWSAPVVTRRRQSYSIAILGGTSPVDLRPVPGVMNPVISARNVTDADAIYVADPFMIEVSGRWHMFFEVLARDESGSAVGQIGLATSEDARHWRYERIVLREPFHLSYPHVFVHRGVHYMIPETHQRSSIRLYRADPFPATWEFERTLVEGQGLADSCPFFARNHWWMFTTGGTPPLYCDALRLFHADDLMGPWVEHPRSPVQAGNRHLARPAGRVVVAGGRIVRFAQACEPFYGTSVSAMEITELTETTYRERPMAAAPILAGSGAGWNAVGMHHVDPHLVGDGQWLACVDGWTWEERIA
ncbi:MAG: hypothetical protein AB7F99_19080 [Vicinamibacterales bacterium]